MAAFILTIVMTFLLAAGIWLAIGSKVRVSPDDQVNDIANLVFYAGAALPVSFILVFFGLGS